MSSAVQSTLSWAVWRLGGAQDGDWCDGLGALLSSVARFSTEELPAKLLGSSSDVALNLFLLFGGCTAGKLSDMVFREAAPKEG